jgi:hypothetical protein
MKQTRLCIIFLLLIVWFAYKNANFFISTMIEEGIKQKATIQSVDFSFSKTVLNNLIIQNPKGSALKDAFTVKEIVVETPSYRLINPHIVIDKITLQDIHVYVEFYDHDSKQANWSLLLKDLNEPKKKHAKIKKSIKINECDLYNIMVTLKMKDQPAKLLPPIQQIILKDLETENGFLIDRVLKIITNHILSNVSIFYQIGGIEGIILTPPEAVIDTIAAPFSWLFSGGNSREN